MQSVNTIMKINYKIICLLLAAAPLLTFAQENSPYSRYGIGNLIPQGNIVNRSMGGISAAVSDAAFLNTVNPAAPANLIFSTLDIALEYNGRNLIDNNTIGNYRSNNAIISYLQVGFPLLNGNKKAFKNQVMWSANFGLKPISKIDYKIETNSSSAGENVQNLYEGSGGLNEAFVGTALKINNLSLGISTGYLFGEKDYSNRLLFKNDSVAFYKSNYEINTRYGGMFVKAGAQYGFKIKEGMIRLGAYGDLKGNYTASRDKKVETFTYDQNGSISRIDSVYSTTGVKGKIHLPSTIGAGFSVEKPHVLFGVDFETTNWDDYQFFGQKDAVTNSWVAKAGVQYLPASTSTNKGYFNFVKYRAGLSFGKDYINADGELPVYTVSVGAGFPLKLRKSFYESQSSVLNVGFEYGNRGNKNNAITENLYKISFGLSLNDVWFRRVKYQ